jgi:class 3 adenylate cyclase
MSEQQIKRKLSAILSADVVGYSRLMGEDEEGTMRRLAELNSITYSVIDLHDGRVFNTAGDAVLAEFSSPVEAVRAAIEIQNAVQTRNKDIAADKQMLFRIGVNLGDVMIKDGDLLGDGVNVAARLQSIAPPGGICISGSVHDQIEGKLDLSFAAMGEQNLKNISRAVRAFELTPGKPAGARPKAKPVPVKSSRGWLLPTVLVLLVGLGAGAYFGGLLPFGPGQDQERERLAWEAVKDSTSANAVQGFLAEFPNGVHAGVARGKLSALTDVERAANEKSRRDSDIARQQAELDRQKAETELARQRAEAEAARLRAEAERARMESDAARQKAEAEAARARAEADAARQRAEAAKKAAEQPRTAAPAPAQQAAVAPPQPGVGSATFDGVWSGTYDCPHSSERLPAFSRPRSNTVRNGEYIFFYGTLGSPGTFRVVLTFAANGAVSGSGPGFGINASPYTMTVKGVVKGNEMTADVTLPTRICTLVLKRQ